MASHRFLSRARCLAALSLSLVLWVGICGAVSGAQRKRQASQAPGALQPPSALVPFRSGERLAYQVLWSKYNVDAARLQFAVVALGTYFGRTAWHFRLQAHTMNTTRMIYPLDDQFDSYTDAAHLTSLQYEMYLHEEGKQQNAAWRMSSGGAAAPSDATAARVPPGTRDPLGMLYLLRAADWKTTPELRTPVFDGHHLYMVVARLGLPSGDVTVPAGQFHVSRIDLTVFQGGKELTSTRFSLWLAQDRARTPVLIEAEVPLGTARIELMASP